MNPMPNTTWIAFARQERIAIGEPVHVTTRVKSFLDGQPDMPVFILDADSSQPVEVDLRGSLATVLKRLPAPAVEAAAEDASPTGSATRGPGRPRLGVVPREVTLLPRHWDWLGKQPGGASVALRKLVEGAQRASVESDRRRAATESAYRFMHALAGNEKGFEDASRALFAGQVERLQDEVAGWPHDVRAHLLELAGRAAAATPANVGTKAAE